MAVNEVATNSSLSACYCSFFMVCSPPFVIFLFIMTHFQILSTSFTVTGIIKHTAELRYVKWNMSPNTSLRSHCFTFYLRNAAQN